MNAASIDAALPGSPSRRLVNGVRGRLALFGIKPKREQWLLTWAWARNIAMSYWKPLWPSYSEIASQYMVLLLADMRAHCSLKLPYRAGKSDLVPDAIRALVASGQLALPSPEEEA